MFPTVSHALGRHKSVASADGEVRRALDEQVEQIPTDQGHVFSDLDWNAKPDEVGLTRFGMSPAEIAYRWQAKQEAERVAAECRELEQQWARLDACHSSQQPAALVTDTLAQTCTWRPVAETNPKKAAKWRSRERKKREEEPCLQDNELPGTPMGLDLAAVLQSSAQCEDSEGSSGAVRARPQRASRKCKILRIYTMNTSSKPAALTALGKLGPVRRTVAVVALQEHHCLSEALPDLQHQAAQLGWNLAAVPATIKEEGPSAGVALVTPKHIPSASSQLVQLDLSPKEPPGRLGGLWVQAGIPGGMLVLSAYLWHSEGMTSRNIGIILHAFAAVKAHGGPWVIVGDFNNPPSVLERAMGTALKAAGAVVIATKEPTHYPGGVSAPAVLDYAIVDDRIANGRVLKYIKVSSDISIGKHRAVEIGVSNKGHVAYVTMAHKPRSFPAVIPVGCARRPVDSPGTLEAVGIDNFYSETLACAEAEIGRRHDLVDSGGMLRKEFVGRFKGFRTKRRLILPPRTSSAIGEAGKESYLLRWVHERLVELQHCAKLQAADGLTVSSLKQFIGIRDRLGKLYRDSDRMTVLSGIDTRWNTWLSEILLRESDVDSEFLVQPMQAALSQCNEAAAKHFAAAKIRWSNWVKDKLKGGASAVHRFVKRTIEAPQVVDGPLEERDASPQAVLMRDHNTWKEVWTRLAGKFDTPWIEGELESPNRLEPITKEKVRAASKTFSARTGVGEDWIRPREVAMLSDSVLDRYAAVLNLAENSGVWPALVTTNLIHLIPKPAGGMRPIGLMATLVRLYERIRRPDIQIWRANCGDPGSFMVEGRSAADAVWVQTVRDEAVKELGLVSASVLLDLIKAFECVRLDVVWRVALRTGFPMAVLRLALRAYCHARRLVYRGVIGDPIVSTNAILAGGGFATDMLALLLTDTLAILRQEMPRVHLFVVVDDLTTRIEGKSAAVAQQLVRLTAMCIDHLERCSI